MVLSVTEKIRTIMRRQGKTMEDVSVATGQSRQNLSNKFRRDNLCMSDIEKIANAMDCKVDVVFTLPDGSNI